MGIFGNCGHQGTKKPRKEVVDADIEWRREGKKCGDSTAAQQRRSLEERVQRVMISNIDEVGRLEHINEEG